ncbi:MAG: glycine--tRNA ligase subunit beta [Marinovum sp.]|mgnify:FL=1|nr:glycine--tRNA ligase subunit beta [Marinovum sp.]
MPDLLIELFSEEIPARMQTRAAEDLKTRVTNGLVEAGLTYSGAAGFSTPRRLTLTVHGLPEESPLVREERKGPRVDAPEKAIEGFLRGTGLSRDQLAIRDEKKGQVYFATIETPGRPTAQIVGAVLENVIRNFPWPKSMRWGSGSLRWVRPLHSILCFLSDESGAKIVDLDIDGIRAGDSTCGHRFLDPKRFSVSNFEDYAAKLKQSFVILDAAERAEVIWQEASNQAFALGLELVEDRGLFAEVAGLVEWPVVLLGRIEEQFLDLPPEVLQASMKEHQKFFSLRNPKTGRIEYFATVANRETADQGATILSGNQKVLAARLADAKFFWENDLRIAKSHGLTLWADSLENVTFHNKLGSQKQRVDRMAGLAQSLAPYVGADTDLAAQAAQVVKADLASEMVYEFPELQGLMGRYYASAAGLPDAVAQAVQAHYSPLGPSDTVPSESVSVSVALADKIDMLAGFWSIDEKPTGSKDPFALRRAALGVIRLLLENKITMPLTEAFALSGSKIDTSDLLGFFHDRLKVFLRDQGLRHDVIDACVSLEGNDDLLLVVNRAKALSEFLASEDGGNLVQGFKRANNILAQAEEKDGVEYSYGADVKFSQSDEERELFAALEVQSKVIKSALKQEDFSKAMSGMAALRAPVDAFFEAVQVNTDNEVVRRNRLNLLNLIRSTCRAVADLTKIEG